MKVKLGSFPFRIGNNICFHGDLQEYRYLNLTLPQEQRIYRKKFETVSCFFFFNRSILYCHFY